jgi:hypothetical protein
MPFFLNFFLPFYYYRIHQKLSTPPENKHPGQNYENFGPHYAVPGRNYSQKRCLISDVYGI